MGVLTLHETKEDAARDSKMAAQSFQWKLFVWCTHKAFNFVTQHIQLVGLSWQQQREEQSWMVFRSAQAFEILWDETLFLVKQVRRLHLSIQGSWSPKQVVVGTNARPANKDGSSEPRRSSSGHTLFIVCMRRTDTHRDVHDRYTHVHNCNGHWHSLMFLSWNKIWIFSHSK